MIIIYTIDTGPVSNKNPINGQPDLEMFIGGDEQAFESVMKAIAKPSQKKGTLMSNNLDKDLENDPDWLRLENEQMHKELPSALERIDYKLMYGIPELKFIGWVICALLALILWRVW